MNKEKGNGSSVLGKQFIEINNLLKTSAKYTGKQDYSCRALKNMSIVM